VLHERLKRVERDPAFVITEIEDRRVCGDRDDEQKLTRVLAQIEAPAEQLRQSAA
jgi:hypothetical protein